MRNDEISLQELQVKISTQKLTSGSRGMDSGHKSLDNSILLVDNLGHGGKAVGGTGGVGNNIGRSIILGVVDTYNEHGSIGGGSRDDNLLGSSSKMCLWREQIRNSRVSRQVGACNGACQT